MYIYGYIYANELYTTMFVQNAAKPTLPNYKLLLYNLLVWKMVPHLDRGIFAPDKNTGKCIYSGDDHFRLVLNQQQPAVYFQFKVRYTLICLVYIHVPYKEIEMNVHYIH